MGMSVWGLLHLSCKNSSALVSWTGPSFTGMGQAMVVSYPLARQLLRLTGAVL
jgi:hypothetical protein